MADQFRPLGDILEPADLQVLEQAYRAASEVLKPHDADAREGIAFDLLQSYRQGVRDNFGLLADLGRKYGLTPTIWSATARS